MGKMKHSWRSKIGLAALTMAIVLCLQTGSFLVMAKETEKAETKTVAGTKTEAKTGTKTNTKTEAKTGTKTNTKTGTKTNTKTEAKAGTKTTTKSKAKASTKPLMKWVEKGQYFYCLDAKGRKAKGWREIDGKTYLFDRKGRQLTGWRKKDGKYYFFYHKNGKGGCLAKKEWANGIWLRKDGSAKVKSANKWRITLLAAYQEKLDTLVKPGMKKREKLKIAFNYAKHKKEDSFGILQKSKYGDNWYLHYAEFFLENDRADCYTRGCGLAFLASAIGYTSAKCVATMGHGFCEINNRVFDPSFAKPYPDTQFPYFNGSYKVYSAWDNYPYKILV